MIFQELRRDLILTKSMVSKAARVDRLAVSILLSQSEYMVLKNQPSKVHCEHVGRRHSSTEFVRN